MHGKGPGLEPGARGRPLSGESRLHFCGFGFPAGALEVHFHSEVALRARVWGFFFLYIQLWVSMMTRFGHAHNTAETHNQLCVLPERKTNSQTSQQQVCVSSSKLCEAPFFLGVSVGNSFSSLSH